MEEQENGPEKVTDAADKERFAADMGRLRQDLETRFAKHLADGQIVAALEARLFARLVELKEYDRALKMAGEYQGSLDHISEND